MSIRGRLRRLEQHQDGAGGDCQECGLPPGGPGRIVYRDSAGIGLPGLPENPDERCPQCGRRLWQVIEVVYEGEGGEPY